MQVEISARAAEMLGFDPFDGYFFDKLLVVSVDGVEAVDTVVFGFMGGGVAQYHQRVKLFKFLNCLHSLHFLRFVKDKYRMIGFD